MLEWCHLMRRISRQFNFKFGYLAPTQCGCDCYGKDVTVVIYPNYSAYLLTVSTRHPDKLSQSESPNFSKSDCRS